MENEEFRQIMKEEIQKGIVQSYKEIFDITDGAMYLKITPDYLRKLCKKGLIKSSKPNGKVIYIHRNELVDYAMNRTEKTVGDASEIANRYLLKKHIKKSRND